jgi:hypothetical protein
MLVQEEQQPIISGGRTAEWVKVDKPLLQKVRKISKGRPVFTTNFDGASVPCENNCGVRKQIDELVLVVHFNGELSTGRHSQTKQDRYYCSVACQRQNYFENPARFRKKTRKSITS